MCEGWFLGTCWMESGGDSGLRDQTHRVRRRVSCAPLSTPAQRARHVTAGAGLPLAASRGSLRSRRQGGGDPARGHVTGANRRSAPSAHSHWSFMRFYTEMGVSFWSLHGCSSGGSLATCSLGSAPCWEEAGQRRPRESRDWPSRGVCWFLITWLLPR